MSKQKKALSKLCSEPPPSDFEWSELTAILGRLGFKLLKNKGSRRKFYHEEKNVLIICHEPHPEPTVDKGCVKDVVETLKLHGFI
ncbi:type II toxin-antitoxin system HicA family toxin [Mangrovitalea sediminis]|uniref:type II toxin-antitoxin system HicA family toxin n=1 Tax=Mangrovitalea sediminis TaxID=1982043 RepID=UPI000BE5A7D3